MNILFITTRYPRSYQEPIVSGVVKNPFSASLALARAGHAVTVITDGPHTGVWDFEGVTVHGVGEGFLKGVVAAFFVDIKISLQFFRMRNQRFDVVHIHSGNLLFFFLLKKMGFVPCPVVYTAHGTSTPELRANTADSFSLRTILLRINGFAQEVIDRVMWSGSDMLVSASDYQIEEMRTLYGLPKEKIVRVYNGVDTTRYFPDPQARKAKREELGLSQDAYVVLFVGRMAPKKGVHLLVNALPSVLEKCPDATFVCVSGNTGRYRGYRSQVEGLRAQGTAQDRFRIIDDVAEADMPDFYNSADVCVFPSLGYESLPTVIYEAMATGVPVITQGSWGTPEVLDEVLLSEEELQGEALPATIVELLSDASRREVISRSYQEKVGRFSWDVLEKEYEELYRGVLKGNRFSL